MTENVSLTYDAVIVGGTPAGIMAGIAVAKSQRSAVILERTAHLGGLPANGLGATDIATRGNRWTLSRIYKTHQTALHQLLWGRIAAGGRLFAGVSL